MGRQTWKIQGLFFHVSHFNIAIRGKFSMVYRQYMEQFPRINNVGPKKKERNDVEQSHYCNGKVLERIQLSSIDSVRFPGRRRLVR